MAKRKMSTFERLQRGELNRKKRKQLEQQIANQDASLQIVHPDTAGIESIGFVGHRELDVMETAKALGCRRVLSKGQLAAELPRLFGRLKGLDMG